MSPFWQRNKSTLYHGDCLKVLGFLPPNCIDTVITDPPYHLTTGKKGGSGAASLNEESPAGRSRVTTGFMGQAWDGGDVAMRPETWAKVMRVCRPGAFLLAFGGTRTFHRMTCAIEDAGWEIRDCLMWLYASGFPKSHNFGCKCRKRNQISVPYNHANTRNEMHGLRDDVPPATESSSEGETSDVLASMQRSSSGAGVGDVWVDGSEGENQRIVSQGGDARPEESGMEGRGDVSQATGKLRAGEVRPLPGGVPVDGEDRRVCDGASAGGGADSQSPSGAAGVCPPSQPQTARQSTRKPRAVRQQSRPQVFRGPRKSITEVGRCPDCGGLIEFAGFGTSLKPAWEPIIVAMKPLDGTFEQNADKWGVAGLNIDAGRVGIEDVSNPDRMQNQQSNRVTWEGGKNSGFSGDHVQPLYNKAGRWPANVMLDEQAAEALDEQAGDVKAGGSISAGSDYARMGYGFANGESTNRKWQSYGDTGGPSRFFYCAKASLAERNAGLDHLPTKPLNWSAGTQNPGSFQAEGTDRNAKNYHPTVKPIALMEYLCKLTSTLTGGVILDPFAGSGSTLIGAQLAGRPCIGIEMQEDFCGIASARAEFWQQRKHNGKPRRPRKVIEEANLFTGAA